VDGDTLMAIAGIEMLRTGRLTNNLVVASVTSNMGLDLALKPHGGVVRRTAVGDRYVWEEMVRSGATLGGEQSGHIILREFTTTGDGLITALQILAQMIARAQPLSELSRCYQPLAQYSLNLPVREKADFQAIGPIRRAIEHVEARLDGRGRVLVRYSGTEPKIRILLEGEDEAELRSLGDRIGDAFQTELGAGRLVAA
jgi:phosphoglucosamine mutase